MRLSKLKLAGFKSFVDPTTVLTPGQLVGIVGPNGCGKSNIIDAVRWVLGETRASALRGESMQDVIFNGSSTRKPVSRASVELVFDNAEGRIGGQWSSYTEIAVKRIVERSGESEYFINNVRVRRKDVIDLFLGTGLGPRAYAIIEQGMISRVIEARPEDVRGFLEEAAGITKYKERRRETEGRLADARDNLARLEDLRAELGAQIQRLSAQAEVAQNWRNLNDTLQARQSLLWAWKASEAQRALQAADQQIADSGRSLEAAQEGLRQIELRLSSAREQHARMMDAVGQAQGDVYAIAAEVSRIENELRALREQRERLIQRRSQLDDTRAQWQGRAASLTQDRTHWSEHATQADATLSAARQAVEGAQSGQPDAEQRLVTARASLESIRAELAQAKQQIGIAESRLAATERSATSLRERTARIANEQSQLIAPPTDALRNAQAQLDGAISQAARAEESLQGREAALTEAQAGQRVALQASTEATQHCTALSARLDALQALQASLRDEGDLADWLSRTGVESFDPLWQQISVSAGCELALEAVLRERLGARGPLSQASLRKCLTQPVPVSISLLREDQAPAATSFARPEGARSLRDAVSAPAPLAPLIDAWLAHVFIVDELDAWLDKPLPVGVMLVSTSGQVLAAGELNLFAPDARTHGVLERQREIAELSTQLEAARGAQEVAKIRLVECESIVSALQAEIATLRQAAVQGQQARHVAQLELVRLQEAQARFDERSAQLALEAREATQALEAEQGQHGELTQALASYRQSAEVLRARQAAATQDLEAAEQGHTLSRELTLRQQQALQQAEFAVRECRNKLDEIARNEALILDELARNNAERERLDAELSALDETALNTSLQTALQLRSQREAELAKRRETQESLALALRTQDEDRLRAEQSLDPLREALAAARLAKQAAEINGTQANERLVEMNVDAGRFTAEMLAEVRETALTREVARLTREIAELGSVNLAALDELASTTERKSFLDAQYDDLMQAIETLEDAIRRIDRETREQLSETYNTVNRHFGELFPQLFGGGEAALVLTGDEILDAGIQIVARPPGKKNTSIHLLSGGEKALTAIALVFAMFQLNPAPFCMLDEVDAPLDDTNTERYCEMVKRMSSVTQFVFISHSKITMERAQQLVGVTMQEQGVSRVVEVDIDEALKLAEPAPAQERATVQA